MPLQRQKLKSSNSFDEYASMVDIQVVWRGDDRSMKFCVLAIRVFSGNLRTNCEIRSTEVQKYSSLNSYRGYPDAL